MTAMATPDSPMPALIRLRNLWWVAAALAVMTAAILGGSIWFLKFVHVMAGVLWTGIDLCMGFAGQSVLYDGTRVIGVRTGDRGIGKDGKPKGAYEPGADIHAKVTIFADGVRGHLTKQLIQALSLDEHSQPAR